VSKKFTLMKNISNFFLFIKSNKSFVFEIVIGYFYRVNGQIFI
jgi:hypothetical protein